LVGILLHRVYADRFVGNFDGRIGWAVLMTVLALFLLYNRIPEPFATYLIYVTFIPAIPILFALTRKNRFDLNLGNLSYPIYVVHSLVLWIAAAVFHHLYGDVNGLKLVMISLVSIGGVLFVSIILYIVIDKPVDEMRQHRLATGRASPQREALQAINVMQQA
jgi:peptidoglycan/LPS O-acetylase OafA/YrhL